MWWLGGLIAFATVMRLMPHEANVAPIAALALFGGIYLRPRHAFGLPLGAMLLSDLALGFDSWQGRLAVYGGFAFVGLVGLAVRRKKSLPTILLGSLVGSGIFYLVTNFVFFYPETMYLHTFSGMVQSYVNALPFLWRTMGGDLLYVGLFCGAYELALFAQPKLRSFWRDPLATRA